MRTALLSIALLLTLGGMPLAFADGLNNVVDGTTENPKWTVTVFNDTGSAVTSGSVMIWDNDDTEFDRTGYPYVTTTTTADSPWTAGVMKTGSCADQQLCEIQVYGPTLTRMDDSTDASAEDTLVGTSTIAGQAGDYGTGANTCALGMLMEDTIPSANDNELSWVFVDPDCQ